MIGLCRKLARHAGGAGLLAMALVAGALALGLASHGTARAQTPTGVQPPNCTGQLTITPSTIYFNTAPEVEFFATGLDASSPFILSIDGQQIGSGSTTPDGSLDYVTVLSPLQADLGQIVIQTVNKCATGTLKIIGPSRVPCTQTVVNGTVICVIPAPLTPFMP